MCPPWPSFALSLSLWPSSAYPGILLNRLQRILCLIITGPAVHICYVVNGKGDNEGMRIIAGRFKGAEIKVPKDGKTTRPTTDRTKEAIFSRLESVGAIAGADVLDLFAGTGALGFEALSRGAHSLVAVEANSRVASCIKSTAGGLCRLPGWDPSVRVKVVKARAEKFVSAAPSDKPVSGSPYSLVFMDPPYALDTEECNILLKGIVMGPVVTDDAVIVVERSARSGAVSAPAGWEITMSRKYGETAVDYIGHS